MQPLEQIIERVLIRKAITLDGLEQRLLQPASAEALQQQPDAYYLSQLCLRVFRAGMTHKVVDAKWPAFIERFYHFEPTDVAMISAEQIEQCTQDTRLIRHLGKLQTIPANAQAMCEIIQEHGSFGHYLAHWPVEQTLDLWQDLGKRFKRLGGNSGPYFLRSVGKDTWVLSSDVMLALKALEVVDKVPVTAKSALRQVQAAFSHWQQQSGRPLCQISQILTMSVGENRPLNNP